MKTFTLRLTDEEAEMLERLAYVFGTSKNKVIVELMKETYCTIDPFTSQTGFISSNMDLAKAVYNEMITGYKNGEYVSSDIIQSVNYINYAIEHTSDAGKLEELEKMKKDLYNEAHFYYFEYQK